MPESHVMTCKTFAGYLQCQTKGQLLWRSKTVEPDFIKMVSERFKLASVAQIQTCIGRRLISYDELSPKCDESYLIDCGTTYLDMRTTHIPQGVGAKTNSEPEGSFLPILFTVHEPIDSWHKTLLCFAAIAIWNTCRNVPHAGYICHGIDRTITKLRLTDTIGKTFELLHHAYRSIASDVDVSLILNKHCNICSFNKRCRDIAIATDNLSLIGTLGEKEHRKLLEKGVTTITQLSYGYRPRRKRRALARATPTPSITTKNDNKLKALALKKGQIHVLNPQPCLLQGTPVYLDVEGTRAHDFFYLIGMRYQMDGKSVESSFWANTRADERTIWAKCVERLSLIDHPCIVHYGNYEKRFLKKMNECYPEIAPFPGYIDDLLSRSQNLVASIYGMIYFPTYTNGLKEIAEYLGFRWTDKDILGSLAPFWRVYWELTSDERIKTKLTRYNLDDCKATEVVDVAIQTLFGGSNSGASNNSLDYVDVTSLEVPYQRTFGKFAGVTPEFQRINEAAYWDYQRDRIFLRNKVTSGEADSRPRKRRRRLRRPDKVVWVQGKVPKSCVKCKSKMIWKAGCQSQTVTDIVFSRRGLRRQITRYAIQRYRCGICRAEMGVPKPKTYFGSTLRAFVIYLLIELRLSHTQIAAHLKTTFDLSIGHTAINDIKSSAATEYEPLYRSILQSIASGDLVHVDETKGVVYGGGHYVWIFTNSRTVAYVYAPTREADVLRDVLQGFSGVLISDFYGAYEAMECQQQKCLIHLMRDMNELVLKYPFNSELADITTRFGTLLRNIVESIDRWGLKARHLRKHKREADKFLSDVEAFKCSSEAAVGLRRRLCKNGAKLFTFLDFDGVPWNNNNAEHAVRAFTRLRNMMTSSTAKGTKDYAVLLSIQQTLKYRNLNFLEFLRSGSRTIEGMG
jgi:predicted RecB family nuclease